MKNDLIDDFETFEDVKGDEYCFVSLIHSNLLCWSVTSGREMNTQAVKVIDVSEGELTRLGIWDKLDDKIRQAHALAIGDRVVERKEKFAGRRRKVDPELAHLPGSVICSDCGEPRVIARKTLEKRLSDKKVTIEEYTSTYVCRMCKAKAAGNGDIPKKLRCTGLCGKEKGTTPVQFRRQLEKTGLGKEEFIASYVCRSCRK